MKLKQTKCPNCGSTKLKYDSENKKYVCEYCHNEYVDEEINTVNEEDQPVKEEKKQKEKLPKENKIEFVAYNNMSTKDKIKTYFKDLFYSNVNTKSLFRFAIYSWITPLIVFIMVCALLSVPSIIGYNKIGVNDITSEALYIDDVIAHTLSTDVKCHVDSQRLICDEGYNYEEIYKFKNSNNDDITYKIIINKSVADMNFDTGSYGVHYDSDNYLIFFETTFAFRYTYHDPKTEKVNVTTLYGFYDKLQGMDFHKIYTTSLEKENPNEYLKAEADTILVDGYKAVAYEQIYTTLVADIGLYVILVLIIGLLLKGNYMLRRRKGFKYSQTIKVALVASLQSAIISVILSLFGFNFIALFGLILVARIIYIHIRYTGSRKNTQWLTDLYEVTKSERFKVE